MFLELLKKSNPRIIINKGWKIYENILENPNSKLWIIISKFIGFLVIVSVGLVFFETLWDNYETYWWKIFILDFFISTVFLTEYIYRFLRSKEKLKFILKPLNIIDLLSFLPFFIWMALNSAHSLDILKVLRIIRVLRLLELNSYSPITIWFIKAMKNYRKEYKSILFLFITILVIDSTFVYYAEHIVNPKFSSIPQALWWGTVTMTTVWYGDMYPITIIWRIVWTLIIFLWPVMLAVTSSITILVFMDVVEMHKTMMEKLCNRCKSISKREANYCHKCGSPEFFTSMVNKSTHTSLSKDY